MNTTEETPDYDRLVIEHAVRSGINSGHLGVAKAQREQAIAKKYARWQREEIRSREALERVKKAMQEGGDARDVITALLGES